MNSFAHRIEGRMSPLQLANASEDLGIALDDFMLAASWAIDNLTREIDDIADRQTMSMKLSRDLMGMRERIELEFYDAIYLG